jgi:hypothetical protein
MEFPLYGKFRGLSPRPMDHDIGPVHGGLSRWQGGGWQSVRVMAVRETTTVVLGGTSVGGERGGTV